ncbi:glycosyltransferase family 4 protein [Spirosoma fluviale]|uniref:Glycosyltransferase involved in cell wall bisynthesis n=1 Tax=Spirosoma fluviale TaxID=1597977 RepID=A0A286FDR8_9BACT|nr:glycosyltransferase family 4 protein [Spirosoma fluviale]SOD81246.1 Glycosyltransferase involved in cell wall bisynthesis [Spirosoma fluviale]
MKVAYMLGALDQGGTETLLLDTLRQIKTKAFPCILVHRKPGTLFTAFEQTGVPVKHQPIRHLFDVGYLVRLRRLYQIEDIQLVHAHLPLDAFLAYWACLGTGIKIVLTIHGYDFGYSLFALSLVRFIITRTDLNLYVSKHLKNYYVQAYSLVTRQEKQQIAYNGIDFSKLDKPDNMVIRQELGIPLKGLLLGSVGNFVRGRDQLTICRLLAELQKRQLDVHLIFVGARSKSAPSYYDQCVSFCRTHNLQERVHFLGSRTDVPAILPQLDAFVYASDHDTFGIAVVEAMAVGLPVFVNDWAVMQEITENGKRAILYKTKDIESLVVEFLHFVQEQTVYKEQAAHNAVWARSTFSIQQHVQVLQEQYRKLLKLYV